MFLTIFYQLFCYFTYSHLMELIHAACATIHHAAGIVQLIEQARRTSYYLPLYSPDLNLIEEAFSEVKYVLISNEENRNGFDIETAVSAAYILRIVDITECICN